MPWTKEDYRAGKMEIDPAAGMSEQDAVNFFNRYRGDSAPTGPVQAPGLLAAGGGGGGAAEGEGLGGPSGAAMAGLSAAAGGGGGNAGSGGVSELAPQGAGNPMLGQRIYPVAMRTLSQLQRAY